MEFFLKVTGALAAAGVTIFSLQQLSKQKPSKSLSESNFLDNPCLLSTVQPCNLGKMNPVGPTYLVQPDPTMAGTSCINAKSPYQFEVRTFLKRLYIQWN